jgi:hypothetical protein
MNSGNPIEDAAGHFRQIEQEEKGRIKPQHLCTFCNRTFIKGMEFEYEKACDDCLKDGTVRRYFAELDMGAGLIENIISQGIKLGE